ncbi:hypothetical protein MNBD_GAMMA23-2370 [hydrothermal vent metagenome]|uniref:Uncharacterized protein n=1 Tax=hydrothermal vent metagenome TaxID=652676 RepID=A0A3B1AYE1_9ZZZZ
MIKTEPSEIQFETEKKLHVITREENDQRLVNQHQALSQAKALELLEPFAKAYLGLYIEIDSIFSPEQRIRFIAGDALADAIMQGLSRVIELDEFPTATEIGEKMAKDERLEFGYVVLVSMALRIKEMPTSIGAFSTVSSEALSAVLCFNYANSCDFRNTWVSELIEYDRNLVTQTLQQFWLAQMDKGVRFLPGLSEQLKTKKGQQLVGDIVLPILSSWSGYKKKTLNMLLIIALNYADTENLLAVIKNILASEKTINPRMRMVWLTSAFILEPSHYWQQMVDYTYRSKEKLLPLLDFSVTLLDEITLTSDTLTKIIRLIAPKFPPHIDDFGELAANPQKTLRLFYALANCEHSIASELQWLRRARVMKIVSPVLDEIELINRQKQQQGVSVDFTVFLANLLNNGALKERRSRFKNKL